MQTEVTSNSPANVIKASCHWPVFSCQSRQETVLHAAADGAHLQMYARSHFCKGSGVSFGDTAQTGGVVTDTGSVIISSGRFMKGCSAGKFAHWALPGWWCAIHSGIYSTYTVLMAEPFGVTDKAARTNERFMFARQTLHSLCVCANCSRSRSEAEIHLR